MFSLGFQPYRSTRQHSNMWQNSDMWRTNTSGMILYYTLPRSAGCERYLYINDECKEFFNYYASIYMGWECIDSAFSKYYDYEYGDDGRAYMSFDECSNPAEEVSRRELKRELRRLGDIRGKAWYIGERPKCVVPF